MAWYWRGAGCMVCLDVSEVGLRLAREQARRENLWLETAVYDLSHPWFPPACFDVILNFRFLERATFPMYRRALKPGDGSCSRPLSARRRRTRTSIFICCPAN